MKLLVFTQVVDLDDPVLGFFHRWLVEFSSRYESIAVVCLREGRHALPDNVQVHSLGKESGRSRMKYLSRFFHLIRALRHEYNAVFVHMNQEYVILGGLYWRLVRKPVYLWRNFHSGDWGTNLAAWLATRVFYTSASSYTARFRNSLRMPVGVDTRIFSQGSESRKALSVLSIGRIAPVKKVDVLIDAINQLFARGITLSLDVYGDSLPKDEAYLQLLKEKVAILGLSNQIVFHPGIPNTSTPSLYRTHDIFVNLSPSGMYDKTIIEAAACGALSIAASLDWKSATSEHLFFDGTSEGLVTRLAALIKLGEGEREQLRAQGRVAAEHESLGALSARLSEVILGIRPTP